MAKKKKRPNVEIDEQLYQLVKTLGFKFGEIFEDGLYTVLFDPKYSEPFLTLLCNKKRISDVDKRIKETTELLNSLNKERNELIKEQKEYQKVIESVTCYETMNMEKAQAEAMKQLNEIKKNRQRPMTLEKMEKIARRNHLPVRALIERLTRDKYQKIFISEYTEGCEIFFYKD